MGEQTQRSLETRQVLAVLGATVAFSGALGLVWGGEITTLVILWLAGDALLAGLLHLRGHQRLAQESFVLGLIVVMLVYVPADGGFWSPGFEGWFPTIVTTAVLLGTRRAMLVGAIALAQAIWLAFGSDRPVTDALVVRLSVLFGTASLSGVVVESLKRRAVESRAHFEAASAMLHERNVEIARRAEVESSLQVALEAAGVAKEARNRFLANMSHELRTPLNAMLGYTELLLEDEPASHQVDDLQRVREAGVNLLALIDRVLELTRIESGQVEVEEGLVQIEPLVRDLTNQLGPLMEVGHNELRVEVEAGLPDLLSDGGRIRRVLLNLLSNAGKFTQDGEVWVRVRRLLHEGHACVAFDVADSGIGIAPDVLEKLFQPFGQADDSHTRVYGGTGLGLHLSRRQAQLLGGEILVESEPGVGSTFRLLVPISTAEQDLSGLVARRTVEARTPAAPVVAVINDCPQDLQLLDTLLLSIGFQPLLCESVEDLRGFLGEVPVRAVFADLAAIQALRTRVGRRGSLYFGEVPVIVTSGDAGAATLLASGAAGWLAKPFDQDSVARVLDRLGLAEGPGQLSA